MAEARENLSRALWLLQLRCSPPLPVALLVDPDGFLLNEGAVVWGLLWQLSQAYPLREDGAVHDGTPDALAAVSAAAAAPGRAALPYTATQRQRLESSLVGWFDQLGVLSELGFAGQPPPTLFGLRELLCDGTLLCTLVPKLVGRRLVGWISRPRTAATARGNIAKVERERERERERESQCREPV